LEYNIAVPESLEGKPEPSPIQLDPIEQAASSLVKEVLKDYSFNPINKRLFLLPIMRFRAERVMYLAKDTKDFIDWFTSEVKDSGYEECVLGEGRKAIYQDKNSDEPRINIESKEFHLLEQLWLIGETSQL